MMVAAVEVAKGCQASVALSPPLFLAVASLEETLDPTQEGREDSLG